MSNKANGVNVKELIYVDNQAIMNNMENEVETIKALLDIIKNLEERLSALDGQ